MDTEAGHLLWIKLAALAVMLALFAGERWLPAQAQKGGSRRLVRNLTFWGANIVLSLAVLIPLSLFAAEHSAGWRPAWWSGWQGLILDLLILDCWIYGWHRLNHAVPFLWRFHQVHHRDHALDVTTAVRFHPGEVLLSTLVRAPLILVLALPWQSIVIFEALVLCATAFHHSNLLVAPWLEAVLSRIIVTPGIHWVHHHDRRADTDSNYATVLSLWDRLFASRSPTRRTGGMTLGVEGERELSLAALAGLPFRRVSR